MRHSPWDGLLVALSVVHAALLLTVPSLPLVAIGMWWNANTISHNFIHLPFFRSRRLNAAYSCYLSGLLGIPQHIWRDGHLRHHAGREWRLRWTPAVVGEIGVVAACWIALAAVAPHTFLVVYVPGYAAGLALCFLQGHYEHVRGTTSHYGRLYNVAFFNDGFHVEHHATPGVHWTQLARIGCRDETASPWPPVLRWLEDLHVGRPGEAARLDVAHGPSGLDRLERLVLYSRGLQRFVLARHERAFRRLLATIPDIHRVTIVGGGLFPRTALILRRLLPSAAITIVDASADHLRIAKTFLDDRIAFRHEWYDARVPEDTDLLVIPLAFLGDRRRIYERPLAPLALVHDWIWVRHSAGTPVSWLLLKRLNLVRR